MKCAMISSVMAFVLDCLGVVFGIVAMATALSPQTLEFYGGIAQRVSTRSNFVSNGPPSLTPTLTLSRSRPLSLS